MELTPKLRKFVNLCDFGYSDYDIQKFRESCDFAPVKNMRIKTIYGPSHDSKSAFRCNLEIGMTMSETPRLSERNYMAQIQSPNTHLREQDSRVFNDLKLSEGALKDIVDIGMNIRSAEENSGRMFAR